MNGIQEERPVPTANPAGPDGRRGNTLGILSLCFCWLPLVGIVLGIVSVAVRERTPALGIVGIVLSLFAPVFIAGALGVGCASCAVKGAGEAGEFFEEATCQSHMRSVASSESVFSDKNGRFGSMSELSSAGLLEEGVDLSCPSCGIDVILDADETGYTVTCPCGRHGSVADGVMSWL